MSGKGNVRFSELFTDTLNTHGFMFAFHYYCCVHKMPEWEWNFWYGRN